MKYILNGHVFELINSSFPNDYKCVDADDLYLSKSKLVLLGATPIEDKPDKEAPHEHKWLYNKWRTEYLSQCALDALCNPHEFEPKLDSKLKYHVCQKCGLVVFKGDKPEKIEKLLPMPEYTNFGKEVRQHMSYQDDKINELVNWINNHERREE